MKKIFTMVIVLLLVIGMSLSAGTKEFKKGASFITGEFGFSSWSTPFGASYEMGLTENIGVGASAWMMSWSDAYYSESLVTPSVFAQYHFTKINVPKLDVAAGGTLGYSVYSFSSKAYSGVALTAGSGLFASLLVTIRYYFTDKIAVSLKETYSLLGDWSGSYTMLGVTYRLK